ncbi:MAG: hypothetical protein P8J33_08850 [Pirellulaceae bacterium]|nr:hypothetical protein [Pirellulaceae bacterium]
MVSRNTNYCHKPLGFPVAGCLIALMFALSIGCNAPEAARKESPATNNSSKKQGPQAATKTQVKTDAKPGLPPQQPSQATGLTTDVIPTLSRDPVEPHPESHRFTDAQLVKDHTIYVLAFDSITRHTYFLSHYRHLMSGDQIEAARNLVDSFKPDFAELSVERETIMNGATDQADMKTLLKNNSVKVLLLSRKVRRGIMHNVYTKEQRLEYNAEFNANRKQRELKKSGKKLLP